MSSSSCADRPARRLLAAALDVLYDEAPVHHALVRDILARLGMHISVSGDVFAPALAGDRIVVGDAHGPAQVTLRSDLACALALFEARVTLLEVVSRGDLDVRGSPDALDAAAAAFTQFLHGLVRAPSGGALLGQLRNHVTSKRGSYHGE